MEHHLLNLEYDGQPLNIKALCRDAGNKLVYDCYTDNVLLGTLLPTVGDDPNVYWIANGMPLELVRLIGNQIENQDW